MSASGFGPPSPPLSDWGVLPSLIGVGSCAESLGGPCNPRPAVLSQDSDYAVAVRNFLPEDPALLAFHKGDIIHLQPLEPPRAGGCPSGRDRAGGTGGGGDKGLGRH